MAPSDVRWLLRRLLWGVSVCGEVGMLFRSYQGFVDVSMEPLVGVPVLPFVVLCVSVV